MREGEIDMRDVTDVEENEEPRHEEKGGVLQKKWERRCCLVGVCVLLLAFGVYFALQVPQLQRACLYPYPYRPAIERMAQHFHVDSSLVAAVILSESKFKNAAQSHKGAVGLMQLMPDTAFWISKRMEDPLVSVDALKDPERNIMYGTWYLAELENEFHGNDVLALAAYNAGRGNVHAWMEDKGWDMNFQDVNAIPFGETRKYVENVLKSRAKYQELYQDGFGGQSK